MHTLVEIVNTVAGYVWGLPLMILLLGTGLWLTVRLAGLQFTQFGHAMYLALIKRREADDQPGDITHFQALMTALSATVGTGNIAGVATAIAAGGPGALFWMWVTGLVGMASKYAEAVLAVKYREISPTGQARGGPMYYIEKGLGLRWLGLLFAFFASISAFGIGNMVQSHSVASAVQASFGVPPWISGLVLTVASALVVIGGIKSISRVTEWMVPVMIVFYSVGSLIVLGLSLDRVPAAIALVFKHAFTPTAASGGFLGATVMMGIRMGVARGLFSNESGLGSSPIAAAAARTRYPVAQGLVSMTQTFIDTLVVCSMTGLVLIVTGTWDNGKTGAELTSVAFSRALPGTFGDLVVTISLILFAYSTILGWCYYGEKSIEYLAGPRAVRPYRIVYVLLIGVGAGLKLDLVWGLADIFNGLMAVPNLIALVGLAPVVARETRDYLATQKGRAG